MKTDKLVLEAYSKVINEELDMNMDLGEYLNKISQSIKTLTGYKKTMKSLMTFINVGNLINKGVNAFDGDVEAGGGEAPDSNSGVSDATPDNNIDDVAFAKKAGISVSDHDNISIKVDDNGTITKSYVDNGVKHVDTYNSSGSETSSQTIDVKTGKVTGYSGNSGDMTPNETPDVDFNQLKDAKSYLSTDDIAKLNDLDTSTQKYFANQFKDMPDLDTKNLIPIHDLSKEQLKWLANKHYDLNSFAETGLKMASGDSNETPGTWMLKRVKQLMDKESEADNF